MLKRKTVLVLGAGASAPFGFPTGIELSQQLVGQLQEGGKTFNNLRSCYNFAPEEIHDFRNAFYYSGKNSVDAFLEHRADYIRIGKAATASVLIGYESHENLFKYNEANWLRYLYNNLGSGLTT